MWSFTCWRQGEIERDPELRAGRALRELEGWPEEVRWQHLFTCRIYSDDSCFVLSLALRSLATLFCVSPVTEDSSAGGRVVIVFVTSVCLNRFASTVGVSCSRSC